MSENQGSTRSIKGRVTSNKMEKSITVEVQRLIPHPQYQKYIKRSTKLMAHDESNICQLGDLVEIISCKPISKKKAWTLLKVVEKAD